MVATLQNEAQHFLTFALDFVIAVRTSHTSKQHQMDGRYVELWQIFIETDIVCSHFHTTWHSSFGEPGYLSGFEGEGGIGKGGGGGGGCLPVPPAVSLLLWALIGSCGHMLHVNRWSDVSTSVIGGNKNCPCPLVLPPTSSRKKKVRRFPMRSEPVCLLK